MMNIGREMAKKLRSVGISSAEELIAAGPEQAFARLRERYPRVCLVIYTRWRARFPRRSSTACPRKERGR